MLIAALIVTFTAVDFPTPVNLDFKKGTDGWEQHGSADFTVDPVKGVAVITVKEEVASAWPQYYQDLPSSPGQTFEMKVEASIPAICHGVGAYLALDFRDAAGVRVGVMQSGAAKPDGAWHGLRVRGETPPGAVTVRMALVMNGHGEASFRNVTLAPIVGGGLTAHVDGPVTLTVTGEIPCKNLIGFGFEDDAWIANPENAAKGVTEEDLALRERRIAWMNPGMVRMFVWHQDWCPSGDWKTFTFDSPNMKSRYRALDLYQRLGTKVNITGVDWGMPEAYADLPAYATAMGAMIEHLVKDRGYTCIQYWTFVNEPNISYMLLPGSDLKRYMEAHRLVRDEFIKRGLPLEIVGSDDAQDASFFNDCLNNPAYTGMVDLFSSHRYFPYLDQDIIPEFYEERLAPLKKIAPDKPFIVGEFGFQDGRSSTFENPIMETYPYALWTTAFAIEGLNRGVAGFTIWSVHEMCYPGGNMMTYALWNYKDRGWAIRPVYHAWAMFTRFARPGDAVRKVTSSQEDAVSGVMTGKTLFWVNRAQEPAEIRLEGAGVDEVRAMTEADLRGDTECGVLLPLKDGVFTAPPLSFGYGQ